MITRLRILCFAFVATASSTFADNTNRETFSMAEKAIQMHDKGQTNEAVKTFQQFAEVWKTVEQSGAYEKRLYTKAAECFLAFGKATNAVVLLKEVLMKSSQHPPETTYLYIKSVFENGDNQTTINCLQNHISRFRDLPVGKRQELAIIGAKVSAKVGDKQSTKNFLKDAVSIAAETQIGKDAQKELDSLDHGSPTGK